MMIEHDPDIRAVEATLFAAEAPMTISEIHAYVGDGVDVTEALRALEEHYQGRGIELVCRGKAWHFQTAADLSHLLRRESEVSRKLSRAGVETLAIIAYHEPVSRAEIEAIRGVQISKGTLDVLMEAGWARPAGRREVPGRPLTYATTPRRDLPGIQDLKAAGLLDPIDDVMDDMDFGADADAGTAESHENESEDRENDETLENGVVSD